MSKTITVQEAKEALKYLKALAPANPKMDDDLEMSIKESIAFMTPDLLRLSKRGFTNRIKFYLHLGPQQLGSVDIHLIQRQAQTK